MFYDVFMFLLFKRCAGLIVRIEVGMIFHDHRVSEMLESSGRLKHRQPIPTKIVHGTVPKVIQGILFCSDANVT